MGGLPGTPITSRSEPPPIASNSFNPDLCTITLGLRVLANRSSAGDTNFPLHKIGSSLYKFDSPRREKLLLDSGLNQCLHYSLLRAEKAVSILKSC